MLARITPGGPVGGGASVPGDKSIAHRWLILAATARGRSALRRVPRSEDVHRTASVLSAVTRNGVPAPGMDEINVDGSGRSELAAPASALDCGNSGTTIRLVAGVLAASPFRSVLTGDDSLLARPMERVADPLRAMGAAVMTTDGRAPLTIDGGELRGIAWASPVPSAQVKSAVLLAGLAAQGDTEVSEAARTRDHTERALRSLGAPIETMENTVRVRAFQQDGFDGTVPGDVSSAAFLIAAAALTEGEMSIDGVGLNPSRTRFLDVLGRMGVDVATELTSESVGEPAGVLHVNAPPALRGTTVGPAELPFVIDEVPLLAMIAAHAEGETRFEGAGELRVKESDRLTALADGLRELGGDAALEGDSLVVAGGGLRGGRTDGRGDHRLAMAFTVGALAAKGPSEVEGLEWAAVSFPGFASTLQLLGARVEVDPR